MEIEIYRIAEKNGSGFKYEEVCRSCAKLEIEKGFEVEFDIHLSKYIHKDNGISYYNDGETDEEISCSMCGEYFEEKENFCECKIPVIRIGYGDFEYCLRCDKKIRTKFLYMKTNNIIKKRQKKLQKNIDDLRKLQDKADKKDFFKWEMQIDLFRMAKEQIDWEYKLKLKL